MHGKAIVQGGVLAVALQSQAALTAGLLLSGFWP
jgi:hypothetical protein